jgi:hypothetical protein
VSQSIFRAQAVRHYRDRRQESVLPRLVCPRLFICLWLLLALFAITGLAGWLAVGRGSL